MNTGVPQPEGSRSEHALSEAEIVRSYYCFTLEQALTALQMTRALMAPSAELDPIIALLQRKLKEA